MQQLPAGFIQDIAIHKKAQIMSDFKPIVSSNLEAASYDNATQKLVVNFRSGAAYEYSNVPLDLMMAFTKTFDGKDGNSAGRFFQKNIRHLPNEKV